MNQNWINSQLEFFWEVIKPKEGYLEIRFKPEIDKEDIESRAYYNNTIYKIKQKGIVVRKNVQFFINTLDELKFILSDEKFIKLSKICYGVNERFPNKKNIIAGSNDHIKNIRFIYFDIEKTDHSMTQNIETDDLEHYVGTIESYLKRKYNLIQPSLINSGSGRHLIYKIKPTTNTEARRKGLKEFVNVVADALSNNYFGVDRIADVTRILGLCGTYNPKRQRWVEFIKISNYENNFQIRSVKEMKKESEVLDIKDLPEITESFEWKVLSNPNAPVGDTNNKIVFAFKLLLKAKGLVNRAEYIQYQNIMNRAWGSNISLNPLQGTFGKQYSKGIAVNWYKKHKNFCDRNGLKIYSDINSEDIIVVKKCDKK